MQKQYFYDAFISYRHVPHDKAIAVKMQRLLESYRPPKSGGGLNKKRIQRIFRDESELPTSGDLGADIQKALEQSEYLIVICSHETAKSQWCMQEIEYFKQLHQGNCNHILTLLVNGDPREVFPKTLCYETRLIKTEDGEMVEQTVEVEPLAANVIAKTTNEAIRKLNTEFLRIAAPILGCSYDDLYKRHQRRFIRKLVLGAVGIVASILLFSIYALTNAKLLETQANQILDKQAELENMNQDLNQNKKEIESINTQLENKNEKLQKQIEETNKQKNIADEQTQIALTSQKEAEDNYFLANEQKQLAQANEEKAKLQEQKAIENFILANEQKALAEINAEEARKQTIIAKENENQATKNLTIASEERDNALRSQSQFLASLSNEVTAKGDKMTAIMLALAGTPQNLSNPERPFEKSTVDALSNAIYQFDPIYNGASQEGFIYKSILNHTMVIDLCSGPDSKSLYTFSAYTICLWNAENGELTDKIEINEKHESSHIMLYESDRFILVVNERPVEDIVKAFLIKKDSHKIRIQATYLGIYDFNFSDISKKAVLMNENNELIYLDLNLGTDLKLTHIEPALVQNIDFWDISRDGKLLAFMNRQDEKVYVVSTEDGKVKSSISTDNVCLVQFLSDNSIVYFENKNKETRVYRWAKDKAEYIATTGSTYELLKSDKVLSFANNLGEKTTVSLIDLVTKHITSIVIDAKDIYTLTLSQDERYAAAAVNNSVYVYVIDLSSMSVFRVGDAADAVLNQYANVIFSPDSRYFVYYNTLDTDTLCMYETARQEYIGRISKIKGYYTDNVRFLSNSRIVLLYGNDRLPYVIDMDKPEQIHYYYLDQYSKAYFNDDAGNEIVSNTLGNIATYDSVSGKKTTDNNLNLSIKRSYLYTEKSEHVMVDWLGKSAVFKNNDEIKPIEWKYYSDIEGSHISKDGKHFLLWNRGLLVVYNAETLEGTELKILNRDYELLGAFFDPNNTSIITYSREKIIFMDIFSGKLLKEIDSSERPIEYMKQSNDGSLLITYSTYSNIISLYDGESGSLRNTIEMPDYINEAVISGDGTKLFVVYYGKKAYIYSTKDGKELMQVPVFVPDGDYFSNCSINKDGTKVLITYFNTGMIFIYDLLDNEKLISIGKRLLDEREFTQEEENKYFLSGE